VRRETFFDSVLFPERFTLSGVYGGMKPSAYEIVDHGIEHEQSFQGCGVFGTGYTAVFTGIGDNPCEALEDALEQAAMSGWDVDANAKLRRERLPRRPCVPEEFQNCHYYVSVRLKA
jgi:hypothetical protein